MKSLLFLIGFILVSLSLTAQDNDSLKTQNKAFIRLHFLVPGIDLEKPLTNHITLKIGFLYGVGYGEAIGGWNFTPYMSADQRYYFSRRKKSTYPNREKYFSNFYLSLQENYIFEANDFTIGPVFGYQITFGRIWYFDIGLGAGYQTNNQEFTLFSTGNFSIGLILDFF